MVQTTQPQRRKATKPITPADRAVRSRDNGLTEEWRKELRALIARRAPALRELEKH